MSKRKIILIITILILLIISLGFFFYINNSNTNQETDGIGIRDFFPFGNSSQTENTTDDTETSNKTEDTITNSPKLKKISDNPVSGSVIFENNGENFVRFVDRATGHIFETSLEEINNYRLTNTTIAQIQEAIWANKDSVFLRYLREDEETIETVLLRILPPGTADNIVFGFNNNLKAGDNNTDVLNLQITLNKDKQTQISETGVGSPGQETTYFGTKTEEAVKRFQEKYAEEILTPQELIAPSGIVDELTRSKLNEITGFSNKVEIPEEEDSNLYETILTFLPVDIKQLTFLEKLQKIFFIQEDNLGSVGTLSDIDGSAKIQIFESPTREWRINSSSGDTVTMTTKVSNFYPGILYSLSQDGEFEKILGGQNGLSGLMDSKKEKIIYSESENNFVLNILNLVNNELTNTSLQTLPEKCIWSQRETSIYCAVPDFIELSNYPDNWYQGDFSSSDLIWKINTENRQLEMVSESIQNNDMDAVELKLSEDEKYLIFTNKKDYSLWSLDLHEDIQTSFENEELENEASTTTSEVGE